MNVSSMDRYGFYHWMQRELESDLKQFYKKIHSIKVLDDEFCIWFINNEDCVSIPLNTMRNIYVNGKSTEELVALIDRKYIARIKK
ncbi:hypothetical protein [Enterocloster clostridioformis]|jgi:hypothetical protein|uniref:Uncharacterized protein n=1 Tax=Enterocloster clostridioformis TaxID=1531 RepID=A0A829WCT9_9FIRM|nr:hypothetical protein [Enterocloster clostridioformis]GEA35110.1 hypothetical protein Ccl03g_08230 [Enterocloster clostridioformis]SFG64021.1 hypothetical protein SAMN05660211_03490 [Enterocloster clostridioformis]